jgi:hypothetical protein
LTQQDFIPIGKKLKVTSQNLKAFAQDAQIKLAIFWFGMAAKRAC